MNIERGQWTSAPGKIYCHSAPKDSVNRWWGHGYVLWRVGETLSERKKSIIIQNCLCIFNTSSIGRSETTGARKRLNIEKGEWMSATHCQETHCQMAPILEYYCIDTLSDDDFTKLHAKVAQTS